MLFQARVHMKKNKEALEEFLQTNANMSSAIRYRKAEQMFQHLDIWKKVDVSNILYGRTEWQWEVRRDSKPSLNPCSTNMHEI